MKKIIVIHFSPDLDAAMCVWLLRRFKSGFQAAKVKFCDAGKTFKGMAVDSDEDIVHVDTGGGRFDHHFQERDYNRQKKRISSSSLVLAHLKRIKPSFKDAALEELVEVVTEVDNGEMLYKWCDPGSVRYEFCLPNILWGIKSLYPGEDNKVLDFALENLDFVYHNIKKKLLAQRILKEKGKVFKTRWGKAVALESSEQSVEWEGRLSGYALVIRRDPRRSSINIKGRKDFGVDLSKVYKEIKKLDDNGGWFLHSSKVLLLSDSRKNRSMKPTNLGLAEVVEIIKRLGD